MIYQQLNTDMGLTRYYYEIYADALEAAANNKEALFGPKEQRFYTLLIFSLAQYLNVLLLLFILTGLGLNIHILLEINIFPGRILNGFLSGFISLGIPLLLLNYFLVFYKKTYLKYTNNRRITTRGWALMLYFIGSALIFILYIIFGKLMF
jgi:hypothetical protein